MPKIIQSRVDVNGNVHLDFSGFVGGECQGEEDRLRRELAALGLNTDVRLAPKSFRNLSDAHGHTRTLSPKKLLANEC